MSRSGIRVCICPAINSPSVGTRALTQILSRCFPAPWSVICPLEPLAIHRGATPPFHLGILWHYPCLSYNPVTMKEPINKKIAFLSNLLPRSSDSDPVHTLLLKDRELAASIRDNIAAGLKLSDDLQVLVLDLAGSAFTPSALQELILPLAQRIRGGEYGMVSLVISTTDAGVSDFIRYMAQAHQLPLYLSPSPFDTQEYTPVGALTRTESITLNTINTLGGQVTASSLAAKEGIKPSAAANRLVNLDREGYLARKPRGRREGDLYFEPRSATSHTFLEVPYKVIESST